MILDGDMIFSDSQSETTVAAHDSTNVVNFGAAHVGYNNKVIIAVPTACTSSGSATVIFSVVTDDNASFSSATTLFTSSTYAYSDLTTGKLVAEYVLPWEVEQYVKIIYTIGTAALTGGAFNAYVDSARQTNGFV